MKKTGIITLVALALIPMVAAYQMYKPHSYFTDDELKQYSFGDKSVLVVKPLLTANAYKYGAFYNYYNHTCGEECLSIPIDDKIPYGYDSSKNMIDIFSQLGADSITDYELDRHPEILSQYDAIILLHSEYVTPKIYNLIINHTNVFYLYPNALYGEVKIDMKREQVIVSKSLSTTGQPQISTGYFDVPYMTLIQGHGYPNDTISNGFGWKYDNTIYESDNHCINPQFQKVPNGYQLTCYPEKEILKHKWIFSYIKEMT